MKIECAQCATERETKPTRDGEPKLPIGWKRLAGKVLCKKCKRETWALRAFSIPVASPGESGSWADLEAELRELWRLSTAAANLLQSELWARDPKRSPGDEKLAKFTVPYLYPVVREKLPVLPSGATVSIINRVQQAYMAARLDTVWFGKRALASYRYPFPYPVRATDYKLSVDEGGALMLDVPLHSKRWKLRLRGGAAFARARTGLLKVLAGDGEFGELAITKIERTSGDHRQGEIMVKIVVWMPVTAKRAGDVCTAVVGGDALLALYSADRQRIFGWNADHIRRGIERHDAQMQRLREDMKAEKRLRRDRKGLRERMKLLADNQQARLDSFCHEVSAQVVGLCQRRRCERLIYLDVQHDYMPHFPWFKLATMVEQKAKRAGIEFTKESSAEVAAEMAGALAGSERSGDKAQ